MSTDERDLIAAVDLSPLAASQHDRARWVSLFADNGVIEDPVGSRAHAGTRSITRFYDTFIGPRDIAFHHNFDIVAGATVIRDVSLEVSLSRGQTHIVPAVLRYDMNLRGEQPTIQHLRAYWSLPSMIDELARRGAAAAIAGSALGLGLLRHQRLSGAVGFVRALHSPARRGRRVATRFVQSLIAGDLGDAERNLRGSCVLGTGEVVALQTVFDRMSDLRLTKSVIAGSTLVASAQSAATVAVVFVRPNKRGDAIDFVECFTERRALKRTR